jgi:hypothetical protein
VVEASSLQQSPCLQQALVLAEPNWSSRQVPRRTRLQLIGACFETPKTGLLRRSFDERKLQPVATAKSKGRRKCGLHRRPCLWRVSCCAHATIWSPELHALEASVPGHHGDRETEFRPTGGDFCVIYGILNLELNPTMHGTNAANTATFNNA